MRKRKLHRTINGIEHKHCNKCEVWHPATSDFFYKNRKSWDELSNYCIQCMKKYSNNRRTDNIYYRYNLTSEEYWNMFIKQEGKCAICGLYEQSKNKNGRPYMLSVDHNHKTGKVRGLLCYKCNTMLGVACDNSMILIGGVKYLKKQHRRIKL